MDGKTILNLSAAIRSRIAPGDDFDLHITERESRKQQISTKKN